MTWTFCSIQRVACIEDTCVCSKLPPPTELDKIAIEFRYDNSHVSDRRHDFTNTTSKLSTHVFWRKKPMVKIRWFTRTLCACRHMPPIITMWTRPTTTRHKWNHIETVSSTRWSSTDGDQLCDTWECMSNSKKWNMQLKCSIVKICYVLVTKTQIDCIVGNSCSLQPLILRDSYWIARSVRETLTNDCEFCFWTVYKINNCVLVLFCKQFSELF
jgi:hypothetical protein